MTDLAGTQAIMRYIIPFTFIVELYLLITNVTYAFLKLRYFLPPLIKDDDTAKRYRRLSEFSVTGVLVITIIMDALNIFWIGDWNTSTTDKVCRSSFRLPYVYFYLFLNCRATFAYARLVMFNYCLEKAYTYTKASFITLQLVMLSSIVWVQWTIKHKVVDKFCQSILSNSVMITIFFVIVLYEVTAFALYYIPLKKTDGLFGRDLHNDGWVKLLTTRDQELDVSDEEKVSSLSIVSESSSTNRTRSTCQVTLNSKSLIQDFHKNVQRNFWAGVLTIFATLVQSVLFVLFYGSDSVSESVGIPSSEKHWYLQSGLGAFVGQVLNIILYTSMVLSDKNWQRAFIPFFFWKSKSWNE